MDTDQIEVLINRNRLLLAMATEERRVCRDARARVHDASQTATEIRQRAASTRKKWQAVRAAGWASGAPRH